MKALDFPSTTASYRQWQLECIAGDVKEAIGRVSDGLFDAEQNANIPTVNYEAGRSSPCLLGSTCILLGKASSTIDAALQSCCRGKSRLLPDGLHMAAVMICLVLRPKQPVEH